MPKTHPTRRSSGGRSLTWSVPDVIRLTWRARSSRPPRRSAIGSSKLAETRSVCGCDRQKDRRGKGGGLSTTEREELARLRRENKQWRVERDIPVSRGR